MSLPRATYRLQFNAYFGFDDATRIAPYLSRLGISHVYASPYLKARPGSMHGYDIVAHDQLNPELGDAAAFIRMCATFAQHGLQQILDFVPNHMGVGGADNPLWLDVLEWGMESNYAGWFDIDWEPDPRYLRGKLLVPLLGDQYGVELESGKLELKFDAVLGEFSIWAYDVHKLPICPLHYESILGDALPSLEWLGDDFASIMEWRPQINRRAVELKQQLASLIATDEQARLTLTASLARFNDHNLDASRRELHELIQLQHWRATHFRVAGDDINYRRFFNINELAGIRIELPDVFDHVHRYTLQLLSAGAIDGLRIDHIDGLIDPQAYLKRLRAEIERVGTTDARRQPTYLIVEKILSQDEQLPEEWPVEGTTGYDFCNLVLGLFIDPNSQQRFTEIYQSFTGQSQSFAAVVHQSKLRIMNHEMASELNVLARQAARVARQTPDTADFTKNLLLRAIREVIACFNVYRTYVDGRGQLVDEDIHRIRAAVAQARVKEREIDPSVFNFLEHLLCGELVNQRKGFIRHTVLRCAMKLQQYSGPVMAKGLEDTAFYRFNRFIALNEVGGHPDRFGISIEQFHAQNLARARRWPHTMLCTSTHDTKRGEDARARLAVLSEVPDEWAEQVATWTKLLSAQGTLPASSDVYLVYQLLISAWPAELTGCDSLPAAALSEFVERLQNIVRKSVREAKQQTTWIRPDEEYEVQLLTFIERALDPERSPEFMRAFCRFQCKVALAGIRNSLAQTVLRMCAPGMPDTYQGTELWDFNMVDPDNRRQVDFVTRTAMLESIGQQLSTHRQQCWGEYLREWRDGRVKLAVLHCLLELRRAHEGLFSMGVYLPVDVIGPAANAVCAFMRCHEQTCVLVVVNRFHLATESHALAKTEVTLPREFRHRKWRELFTDQQYAASSSLNLDVLFSALPVAVLISSSSE